MSVAEQHREYQAATQEVALFDLCRCGKIEVSGPDARSFLHNLCTQDVKNMPVGAGGEAFLVGAKGRVIAHLWIGNYQTDTGAVLWLDLDGEDAAKVVAHLQRYLISENADIADRTRDLALFRLVGPGAADLMARVGGVSVASLKPLHHVRLPGTGYVRRQDLLGSAGFDLFCAAPDAESLRQRLIEAGAVPAGNETYQVLRVEAGLPAFGIDIDENRLAMEVGRTQQAISFNKGCYLGQETIVMARDRGQVNRQLLGVKVATGAALAPGMRLFRGADEVGQVTSSVYSPSLGQVIALAYLRRGNWDAGTELTIEPATDGRGAVVCSLPFVGSGPVEVT